MVRSTRAKIVRMQHRRLRKIRFESMAHRNKNSVAHLALQQESTRNRAIDAASPLGSRMPSARWRVCADRDRPPRAMS